MVLIKNIQSLFIFFSFSILGKLAYWNYTCLSYFMCLFHHILSNSVTNNMNSESIAVCVAPSLFHKQDRPNDYATSKQIVSFVCLLLENIEQLFGKQTLRLIKAVAAQADAASSDNACSLRSMDFQHNQHLTSATASIASSVITTTTATTATTNTGNINELDTDSNDGHHNDSSIDDVIGTSSEIEILDLAHSLTNKNLELNSLLTQSLTGPAAILATQSLNGNRLIGSHLKTNLLTTSNHHDFSSNTLSVDSGLSVPTATSDPESEKSSESAVINSKLKNETVFKQQQQLILKKEQDFQLLNVRSQSTREEPKESTKEIQQIHSADDKKLSKRGSDDYYFGNESLGTSVSSSTLPNPSTIGPLDNNLKGNKIYKKVTNNTLNSSNKKYAKKNSIATMKQFSESDVFYDSSILKDDSSLNKISVRLASEESFEDYVNNNLSSIHDTDKSELSRSAINLKSYTTNAPQQQQQQQAACLNTNKKENKKSLIKINFEKSINQLQTNVLKGINMSIGIASDILTTFQSSTSTSTSNLANNEPASNTHNHRTSSASSVYLPQTSATLTKVNIMDRQQSTTDIQPTVANASTMTTARRKVSKTKDDYKPSKQFVENLQATQRNRNYSATSSTGSSSSGISRNSSRESSLSDNDSKSIKQSNSSANNLNDNNLMTTANSSVQNNREQYKRSKKTRNKNSVLRAKSFNYQTTSSPIEVNNNPTKNPNLTASVYTSKEFTNQLNNNINKRNIRRSVSLKHYKDDSLQYSDKSVIENQPNVTPIFSKNDNAETKNVTKIVNYNISKVDTSISNSNSSATPTVLTTSVSDLQKVPNTSITSFIELKSTKPQQKPQTVTNDSSHQYITKVYTSNMSKPSTLSRSTNLQDYRPVSSYFPTTSKSIASLTTNNVKDSINSGTLGGAQSLSSTLPANRLSVGGINMDNAKSLNELKNMKNNNGMLTTLPSSNQDQNLVNVTWSVSNIRKQFEQAKQMEENNGSYRQLLQNTPPTMRKPIQSISSIFQVDQQSAQQQVKTRANSATSPETSSSAVNNYLSTVKINRSKNVVNFKDIYGNPTTYI